MLPVMICEIGLKSRMTYAEIANFLNSKRAGKSVPLVGIICGSGLSHLADNLTNAETVNYEVPTYCTCAFRAP